MRNSAKAEPGTSTSASTSCASQVADALPQPELGRAREARENEDVLAPRADQRPGLVLAILEVTRLMRIEVARELDREGAAQRF